jgi:hypothetical protein
MVQSNGTRAESHLFKIDFTGRKKYSGFSKDFRFVSAAGASAARRAMPTSGAWEVGNSGGGQSAVGLSRLALRQPAWPWARVPASGFGSAGLKGRSCVAGRRTGRRRIVKRGVVWGRTGDMAHLDARPFFRFLFAMSRNFLPTPPVPSPPRSLHSDYGGPILLARPRAPLDRVFSGSPPHARIKFHRHFVSVQRIAPSRLRFDANSGANFPTKASPQFAGKVSSACQRAHSLPRLTPLPHPDHRPWQ